jgi:hypothetical protein
VRALKEEFAQLLSKRKFADFEIVNKLGAGGEGDVFIVRDLINQGLKVMKVMREFTKED